MRPGIYVHLPFCAVHCIYCDFPLTTRISLAEGYYKALLREIAMHPAGLSDTLYFGGGTPSMTPPEVLLSLRQQFPLEEGAEITLEANPDDVTAENLEGWKRAGVMRLSLGIQSLQDEVLRWMGRRHSAAEAIAAFQSARNAGFSNLSIDLMIGT